MLHFGSFDIRTDIFVLILSAILLIAQLLLCFKVKKTVVRLIPVCLLSCLTVVFTALIFVFEGWDSLGFLIIAICSAALLLVCGLGWGIWWLVKNRKNIR